MSGYLNRRNYKNHNQYLQKGGIFLQSVAGETIKDLSRIKNQRNICLADGNHADSQGPEPEVSSC